MPFWSPKMPSATPKRSFWEALGGSGAVWGGSWAVLEAPETALEGVKQKMDFKTDFGPP